MDQIDWNTNARSTDHKFRVCSWNFKDLLRRSEEETSGSSVHSLEPYFFLLLSRIHTNAYVSQVTSCCQGFWLNFVRISHLSHGRRTCKFHLSHPPYFDASKMFDEDCKLRSSSLRNVSIHSSVTSQVQNSLSNPFSGTCLLLTVEHIINMHNT
jgi:hypothetical protein